MAKNRIKNTKIWFLYGMLLGAVCFVLIYGIKVLDVTNDSWIMLSKDPDIKQHYLGWCHYRKSPWGFPIGMIDSLSYPYKMSVIYTDSIPLFAVIFKALRFFLPKPFQYLGIYGLLSMMLTGGFATLLVKKVSKGILTSLMAPILFIVSPIMLQRMFYHTSLASQWIILWGIYVLFDQIGHSSKFYQKDIWMVMGITCVLVHIYFMPIIFGLMCAASLEKYLKDKEFFNTIWIFICNLLYFSIPAAITMFVFGAFDLPVNSSDNYAVGEFNANLNTFINPGNMSRILKELPIYGEFQHEGFAYLGLGMILLIVFVILAGVSEFIVKKGGIKKKLSLDTMSVSVILVSLVFLFFSISPVFAINDKLIFAFKYPDTIASLIGVFRSNGRFIWPVIYFIYLGAIQGIEGVFKAKWIPQLIILLICVIQIFDLSEMIIHKREVYALNDETYSNIWEKYVGDKIDGYERFIMFTDHIQAYINVGYYSYMHDKKMSRFYFARDIDEAVTKNLDVYSEALHRGESKDDEIYVFWKDGYKEYVDCGLHFYNIKYIVFGTKNRVEGLEEVSVEELLAKEADNWGKGKK